MKSRKMTIIEYPRESFVYMQLACVHDHKRDGESSFEHDEKARRKIHIFL